MNQRRFRQITGRYAQLRVAVVGDFSLDRYLEIDPRRREISIETRLPVHNVVAVKAQAGAAGTVVNNLAALGVGAIFAVGFCGGDGEGFELRRALAALPGVRLDYFLETPLRRTFCYCKPMLLKPGAPARELSRLDSKNWTATPARVVRHILKSLRALRGQVDALIVLDQVDEPETGVITRQVRDALKKFPPEIPVMADSRRGLAGYPPLIFKMNAAELRRLAKLPARPGIKRIQDAARELAKRNGREVIVTLSERGMIGARPDGFAAQVPCFPLRGPIDIVGAGDAVTANAAVALAAGADLPESLELASAAASIAIHQLGTTGTATVRQLGELLAAYSTKSR